MFRIVEAVDVEAGFCEQVSVSSLAARNVENPGPRRQAEQVDNSCDFGAIPLESEEGLILEKVVSVEVRLPPLAAAFRQKNTGSRYAPNTSSRAARISWSVQYARAASSM